jgi:hypothetical protein
MRRASSGLDTTTTTVTAITITSSLELTTAATIVIAHVNAIATSPSILTSPICSPTNKFRCTTGLNGTIDSANARGHEAFGRSMLTCNPCSRYTAHQLLAIRLA